ncbi:50S ribosomal protein L15 [Botrimarina sp.]|uniref:50S ribosomal protein L15 n=1 Tax=Botrimarina sp. TaxID=2795802 RepID=UPI0032F02670
MILNDVNRGIHKNRKRKRIGRGPGSGHGKTAGRGHKGAGSRAGSSPHRMFAGGSTALWQRIPKRGFNNKWAKTVVVVNVGEINDAFADGDEVTPEVLKAKNLAKGRFDELKILGEGELTKKLTVSAHRFSKSAAEKIEKAGGSMVVVPGKTPVAEKQGKTPKKAAAAGGE